MTNVPPEPPRRDLDESTSRRSDDWMRALGAQDLVKEEVRETLQKRSKSNDG